MKILRFELPAFGPFTNAVLDLSGGAEGLHVVYGPNEAGKSSALRALRQLLFGIDGQTGDDFIHPYPKLRLRATLRHSNGTELSFVRRKGRAKTLLSPDEESVLDESDLSRLLGALREGEFRTMFGLTHQSLREGGRQIAEGGGDVGQILFAAGAGLAELRTVQNDMQCDLEALFKPNGQKQQINTAIAEFKEAQDQVQKAALPHEEWTRHADALREARQRLVQVEAELAERRAEQSRLERIHQALPAVARYRQCGLEQAQVAEAVLLPAGFAEERRKVQQSLRDAELQQSRSRCELERLQSDLATCPAPDGLLEAGDEIDRLYRNLGVHQKAVDDGAGLQVQRDQLRSEASITLRDLRPDLDFETAGQVRLTAPERIRIQNLANEETALQERLKLAREAETKAEQRLKLLEDRLAGYPAPPDADAPCREMRRLAQQANLDEEWRRAAAELRAAEQRIAADLQKLRGWSGTLDELEGLALPTVETIDRFEGELDRAARRQESTANRIGTEEEQIRTLDGQIEQLRLEQDVPTEDELTQARERRDAGWRLVRREWLGPAAAPSEVTEFVRSQEGTDLPQAYERAVSRADEIADRLRREAERVARKIKLQSDRDQRSRYLEQMLRGEHRAAIEHFEQACRDWGELWSPLGIAPLSPREMRAWLQAAAGLNERAFSLARQREQVAQLQAGTIAARERLNAALRGLEEPILGDEESLKHGLERAQQALDSVDGLRREREQSERDLVAARSELPGLHAEVQQAEERLADWRARWGEWMTRLGLPDQTPAAEAAAFLERLTDLFKRLDEALSLDARVRSIEADAARFAGEVRAFAERFAPDLSGVPFERAVSAMQARLQRAREDQKLRLELLSRRAREEQNLNDSVQLAERMTLRLAGLCDEARCAAAEGLPEAEARSVLRQEVEARLRDAREQILHHSGNVPLDEFIAQAEAVDQDSIVSRLESLAGELAQLQEQQHELIGRISAERTELARMDGGANAAEAAERAASVAAHLEGAVEEYVRLKLAAAMLRRGLERYREQHQNPVLLRAGEIFAGLTLGAFERLQIDYTAETAPVLVGIRAGGEMVRTEGMSDGTADQLYLALRLASLEGYIETNEPVPFIVDDVLLNFDNGRAAAALGALAELSRRTQVIFFTHHQHLLDMGRAVVGDDLLFVHHLNAAQFERVEAAGTAPRTTRKRKTSAAAPDKSEQSLFGPGR